MHVFAALFVADRGTTGCTWRPACPWATSSSGPAGTYVWNSYGGKSGKRGRGDANYPVVLIDTVENRRWKVGVDPKRTGGRDIVVWDGQHSRYDGRR